MLFNVDPRRKRLETHLKIYVNTIRVSTAASKGLESLCTPTQKKGILEGESVQPHKKLFDEGHQHFISSSLIKHPSTV